MYRLCIKNTRGAETKSQTKRDKSVIKHTDNEISQREWFVQKKTYIWNRPPWCAVLKFKFCSHYLGLCEIRQTIENKTLSEELNVLLIFSYSFTTIKCSQ